MLYFTEKMDKYSMKDIVVVFSLLLTFLPVALQAWEKGLQHFVLMKSA